MLVTYPKSRRPDAKKAEPALARLNCRFVDSAENRTRPRIAEIISSSGVITGAIQASPDVIADVAALAGSIVPGVAGKAIAVTMPYVESVAEALVTRLKLSRDAVVRRDYSVPYETAGRALILALHALDTQLKAAFDTASGAVLEATEAMTHLEPAYTFTIALGDTGANTARISATSHITISDLLKFNEHKLAALFAQIDAYLALFAS
jgi:hypothetical protein